MAGEAIAAALVGSVFGSCLGFVFLRPKLRMEARYDRFLQWCESMVAEMNEAGAALVEAIEHPREDPEKRKLQIARVLIAYDRFLALCRVKEVYAEKQALAPIHKALTSFEKLLRPLAEETGDEIDVDTRKEQKDTCLNAFRRATQELMREAREHMGHDPLEEDSSEMDERFALRIIRPAWFYDMLSDETKRKKILYEMKSQS